MKMRIKISKCIILISMIVLSACGVKEEPQKDTFKIVTSFYPMQLFTMNVADQAENVEVSTLTLNSSGCLHGYNLNTTDMQSLEDADILIINGAGMESFIESIKETYPNLYIGDTSEGIELTESKFEDNWNSHIWLSLSNAEIQVQNIKKMLAEKNPENADKYTENTEQYIKLLKDLKNNARESLYGTEEINVVTMHDAFPYLAEDMGINVVDVVQRDADESPTPKQLIDITDSIKTNNVKAIIIEPQYSDKIAKLLSKETGAGVYTLDSIVIGENNKEDYINKMRKNIETIKEISQNQIQSVTPET